MLAEDIKGNVPITASTGRATSAVPVGGSPVARERVEDEAEFAGSKKIENGSETTESNAGL
jgi:hypothetical protein